MKALSSEVDEDLNELSLSNNTMRAQQLIQDLHLQPHPEGGYYREIFRSSHTLNTERGDRVALTCIYFLLAKGNTSVFHSVTSDEIWHFLEGAPLRLISLTPDLYEIQESHLSEVSNDNLPVAVIQKDHWQAAESLGDYTLVSCSVGPGFDFDDFRLMRSVPQIATITRQRHPHYARFIGE